MPIGIQLRCYLRALHLLVNQNMFEQAFQALFTQFWSLKLVCLCTNIIRQQKTLYPCTLVSEPTNNSVGFL